jgi:hypothetical protein
VPAAISRAVGEAGAASAAATMVTSGQVFIIETGFIGLYLPRCRA